MLRRWAWVQIAMSTFAAIFGFLSTPAMARQTIPPKDEGRQISRPSIVVERPGQPAPPNPSPIAQPGENSAPLDKRSAPRLNASTGGPSDTRASVPEGTLGESVGATPPQSSGAAPALQALPAAAQGTVECPCCLVLLGDGNDYICRPPTCTPNGRWGPVCPPPAMSPAAGVILGDLARRVDAIRPVRVASSRRPTK
jgi:hypothetical protein